MEWILGSAVWLYTAFNDVECLIWIGIGLALFWKLKRRAFKPNQSRTIIVAGITFIFFGITDYFEAALSSEGLVPLWIWAWKIFCGAVLVKCRYDYGGIDRSIWIDRYSFFLLAIMVVVFALVAWTWIQVGVATSIRVDSVVE